MKALSVYEVGKPLVVEEIFPLKCSLGQLDEFIMRSRGTTDGWIGFFWGKTIEEYRRSKGGLSDTITGAWLEYFRQKAPAMRTPD